jgi:hypothetical protein
MDRISAANYATVGGLRMFQDPNLGANTEGTGLNALWHTGAQESILASVEGTGQVPTDADNTQLFKAIKRLAGGNLAVIVASRALTPDNAGLVIVSAAAGAIALELPLAGSAGWTPLKFIFVRVDNTANAVTVTFQGGDTNILGGTTPFVVPPAGAAPGILTVVGDGYGNHWASLTPSLGYALLAGSSSQAFNVADAVTATEAVALGQINAPMSAMAANNGTNTTLTVSVSFTAPVPGALIAIASRNNEWQAASASSTSLYINGSLVDSDNTEVPVTNMGYATTAGGGVSASFTAAATVQFSTRVMLIFIPNL